MHLCCCNTALLNFCARNKLVNNQRLSKMDKCHYIPIGIFFLNCDLRLMYMRPDLWSYIDNEGTILFWLHFSRWNVFVYTRTTCRLVFLSHQYLSPTTALASKAPIQILRSKWPVLKHFNSSYKQTPHSLECPSELILHIISSLQVYVWMSYFWIHWMTKE